MQTKAINVNSWIKERIKPEEVDKYLKADGKDFINDKEIEQNLSTNTKPDIKRIKDIIDKSLSIQTLTLEETACLLNAEDAGALQMMAEAALKVKKKVYDNRIVTFAPLYLSNICVNDCAYCGFRRSNTDASRRVLSLDEVKKEIEALAGEIGHKRLIAVYGEHPLTDVDYMVQTLEAIYGVKAKTKNGFGQIRRVNINAAPLSVEALKRLHQVGIGTYQVFQETYHHQTYKTVHPEGTIKGNYKWRLYCLHRAMEAGVDDVGLGALFGLYDWRFEVMGLVAHSRELEEKFGIGAHTISFPRLEPSENTPFCDNSKYKVSDRDFIKLITVIRLAVPHTGMIITARETAEMRRKSLSLGITQTDASSKIGIGAYSERGSGQEGSRQQFFLGDTRSLDEVIREFADMGCITSFCTAGYRCGRTGKCIMDLLRTGKEGQFCKLNAVLTFREWLNDFAGEETKKAGEKVIEREIKEVKVAMPGIFSNFMDYYERIKKGERDLYF
ncbi:MAG: [FeFe] hydrogenase H-cluster radical SAM maturase HydG [Candidatus Omnitrophica bacterium]|nr:[FeFe] hydrogenase H-cluster radical SAM maturase HydG [Candidatus Omnitrophota bacterium]